MLKEALMTKFLRLTVVTAFILSIGAAASATAQETVNLEQVCGSNMDSPMAADFPDRYTNKQVKITIEVDSIRKIPSICGEGPEGTFTLEAIDRRGTILECFCTDPQSKSVLDSTPKGSKLTAVGTFRSVTGSYAESESEECKITLDECSFGN